MTDTTITLAPSAAMTTGPVQVVASAALFTADDVGRAISIQNTAPARVASTAYAVGQIWVASYAGVDRLYRVIKAGTTAAASLAGTTPNYDLSAPRDIGLNIPDGTATIKYLGSGKQCWGFGTITAFTNALTVTASVDPTGPFVSTAGSLLWKMGEFSDARGWPASVTFNYGRTWWGGTTHKPQTVWASETGDYENMTPHEPDGTVLDTSAITLALDDDQINTIRWIRSFARGMAAGTASGEFTIGPQVQTAALSPSNVKATRQTDRGSDAGAPAIRTNGTILFVQRGGTKLREISYDFASDSFLTPDLTQISDTITGPGIVEAGYVGLPDGQLWCVRADGDLAVLTYDREQKVRAWTHQQIAGGFVESLAVVPSPDGTTDEIMLAVRRTFMGVTTRTVEWVRAPYRADLTPAAEAFFVDGGLSYSGTPARVFSGLNHLEGQVVAILADGSVRNTETVMSGAVTITGPQASTATIGLPYESRFLSVSPETQGNEGTSQGQLRRIAEVSIRFLETGGGQYGRDGQPLEPIIFRTLAMPMGTPVPLFTGDRREPFPAGWDRSGQMVVQTSDPLPLTILAVITEITTNG